MGFVAIWCQFAQTTFYYPALLAYVASTLAYVFAPSLAHSGLYTTVVIIVLFWAAVLVSARGVLATGRLASYGIFIGTLIPGLLLVLLAAIYLLQGNASAAPLNAHHVLPPWHGLTSVVLIVNSFFLYAGVEVNAVHVDELRDAPREFPKATLLAVILILLVFISPTLAISVAVPAPHISFTAGVMQAFKSLLDHFGLNVLTPIIAVGLVVASLSGLLDWLTGPSTGLLGIARERGYLPRYFQELNSNGVQLHILVAQGLIITVRRPAVQLAAAQALSQGVAWAGPRRARRWGWVAARARPRGGANRDMLLVRRVAQHELEVLYADPETEFAGEVWDLRKVGLAVGRSTQVLDFSTITQDWLREAAKGWARARGSLRRAELQGAARGVAAVGVIGAAAGRREREVCARAC